MTKIAVVLFNLGGPDSTKAIYPFLRNLFSDPAILRLPFIIRYILARVIAISRVKEASKIYEEIGGKSPILENTQAQAQALEKALNIDKKNKWKLFIAMRYWHPMASEAVKAVEKYNPDKIILLPLYPQYSTTTTSSSIKDWMKEYNKTKHPAPTKVINEYPAMDGFIKAYCSLIQDCMKKNKVIDNYRILFSAHGLPQKIVDSGDPYADQIKQSVEAIVKKLKLHKDQWLICYQSRVGPIKWLEPSTEDAIEQAAKNKKTIILVPIAFVSEHSETLVELDITYADLAKELGAKYYRVPTVSCHPDFIMGLAKLCYNIVS